MHAAYGSLLLDACTTMRRSGPPSNNSGVEWYNTGSTADFPSASSNDYAYNAMPGYNISSASGSFEDEQPLLEGADLSYGTCIMLTPLPWAALHGC